MKNFQLVQHEDSDDVILQFGKIDGDEFTMDYKWPMSALQAVRHGIVGDALVRPIARTLMR